MIERFSYDVFLSYSPKDIASVRKIAERLRGDGVKVWFDEWLLKPNDDASAKIELGLERSRVLVLCMSRNAFDSEWSKLERQTFRFRDPLNQHRRFVPLRLDKTPLKGFLHQYLYVDWAKGDREQEYKALLDTCRPLKKPPPTNAAPNFRQTPFRSIELVSKSGDRIENYCFNPDGKSVLAVTSGLHLNLWDLEKGRCVTTLNGHTSTVWSVDWSPDKFYAVSCSDDQTARIWDLRTATCLIVLEGHSDSVQCAKWSPDQRQILTGSDDNTVRLWDAKTGRCKRVFEGHTDGVWCVAWNLVQRRAMSGAADGSLRLWNLKTGRCERVLEGHEDYVRSIAWNTERGQLISGSDDNTVRLWDIDSGRCLSVLEGHQNWVLSVAWHPTQPLALSGSYDETLRLWNTETGRCLRILKTDGVGIETVAWSSDGRSAFSGDRERGIRVWDMTRLIARVDGSKSTSVVSAPEQVQYTNAKVLLVGESGTGKTGLSKVLAGQKWKPSDSTIGAWATQWKLEVSSDKDIEKEIWLWDFGGQADQRLIHQLYMDETALAVLVFDGQKDDLFETLGQWDRDLTRASRKDFAKLLVAGRVDAGGLRVSRSEIEKFATERKFRGFLETSAKKNLGCDELKKAILTSIDWNEIPCRTTEVLFKKLKEEIIRLKDEGRVLMRFNELRETLQLRLSNGFKQFSDKELRAVLTLLTGPGVVWELAFGNWVLLQPERINAYAQAVIRTLQSDEHQRGCLMEERVLKGELDYESSMPRLSGEDERFVLLAMHQILVERGLCLRQPTSKGNLLVFPSYYRRERSEQKNFPAVHVNYRFTGFLDDIYATLVVRLHHSDAFDQDQLWRYAADFKTKTGKQLGVKLSRRAPGVGDLEVYFDPSVAMEEKIIFSKYVHEHLLQHARDVERLRHYVCEECGTPVGNREVAMQRLNQWLQGRPPQPVKPLKLKRKDETPTIICVGCERRVPLWDDLEQCFASAEIQQRVRDMQEEAAVVLSNQSKERVLVGEVISTVALANQISREFSVSDHGIDMEIEFTDDNHEATGAKIYLQLKSGDSYLHKRKQDGTEVFGIKNERHVRYWMAQGFPVLLVIRNSEGEVRWMEVRDWLKRESDNGKKPVKQIVFDGERFDVMSVRRWRDRCLGV
jgi:small GTP-binding protein